MMKKKDENYQMELIKASMETDGNVELYKSTRELEELLMKTITDYFLSLNKEIGYLHYLLAEETFLLVLMKWRSERYEREKHGKVKEAIPDKMIDALFSYFDKSNYHGETFISGMDDLRKWKKRCDKHKEED